MSYTHNEMEVGEGVETETGVEGVEGGMGDREIYIRFLIDLDAFDVNAIGFMCVYVCVCVCICVYMCVYM
jgi:hypothetical protein